MWDTLPERDHKSFQPQPRSRIFIEDLTGESMELQPHSRMFIKDPTDRSIPPIGGAPTLLRNIRWGPYARVYPIGRWSVSLEPRPNKLTIKVFQHRYREAETRELNPRFAKLAYC